ncbi:hypothetical protein D1007_47141 [Hordeum vulgare]|nr:hypothetical protein D1007_47141 [Hordeum vulgare]
MMVGFPFGSWEGSLVKEEHIEYIRRMRKLSFAELVEARAPNDECMPEPRTGERVIFSTHFLFGFGLPASLFLRQFLAF